MNPHDLPGRPVIIGAGLAGLAAALASPEPVLLVTAGTLEDGAASLWSQGGIAAAIGADDGTALHAADTIAAGDGLCDPGLAARITADAPAIIEDLIRLGAQFDRDAAGGIALGLEAAHSRRRIAHAGDRTGLMLTRALAAAARAAPHVALLERTRATGLHVIEGRIGGVFLEGAFLRTGRVLIATGGIGGLYAHTSNPLGATGSGLALAARAGAVLRDLELVQFHPTALDAGRDPMPLISEAVRGEGATLIDETGARFMADTPGAELAPRDIVARAVFRHLAAGHRVFLDARHLGQGFGARFSGIDAACRSAGIDPGLAPIPIRPAAHYHMGGIAVAPDGTASIPGLFAAGEAACTGFHGANRLASNSLLEAVWLGGEAARAMAAETPPLRRLAEPAAPEQNIGDAGWVRPIVSRHLGVLRDGEGLTQAIMALTPRAKSSDPALVTLMLAVAAFERRESRGGHARADFPDRLPIATHSEITMDAAFARAAELSMVLQDAA